MKYPLTNGIVRSVLAAAILFCGSVFPQPKQAGTSDALKAGNLARQYYKQHLAPAGKQVNPGNTPEAMQARVLTGRAAGNNFGQSAANAGDVNGDGYNDIIIGAPSYAGGAASSGGAFIYFGGPNIKSIPDVILKGEYTSDKFGYSVSGGADFNGDGYADVIVGAPGSSSDAGKIYIYFGGPVMSTTAALSLSGTAGEMLGSSVANAGDVNADGFSDFIIGAKNSAVNGTQSGRAIILFGALTPDTTPDAVLPGEAAGDLFGYSVSSAGDVNGDGYCDIVIGAPFNSYSGAAAGRAYVYFGGSSVSATPSVILSGAAAGDRFGHSVSSAGDVNADGYMDVIAGAPYNDNGGSNSGRAYVFYGGSSMNATADVILTGQSANDNFGCAVSAAGDVNGDGYSDFIIGAQNNSAAGALAGKAYVYFGAFTTDSIPDVILTGSDAGDNFGSSFASSDFNGDGVSDVLAGAPLNDANGTDAGRVYVYTNSMTGADIADESFFGVAESDYFGYSVASAGDVNGDGYQDIIIGAAFTDNVQPDAGSAYIFYGGPGMHTSPDVILNGTIESGYFGETVAGAGDVNGDGYADVIVGAPGSGPGLPGKAYIFFGGSPMNSVADITCTGTMIGDYFGNSVACAGDVNGDGYADIIVGAPADNTGGSATGRSFIFFGGAAMNNTADVILKGAAVGDQFGTSVAGAGDVNGDGFADVIVGAPLNNSAMGKAYIFFGGETMSTSAGLVCAGTAFSSYFGSSVACAGDVNGDGFSDVIIGAPLDPSAGSSAGKAFLYYGSTIMDNTADIIISGNSGDQLGYSVASAGDVNGDGYSDVAVGMPENNSGGNGAGRVQVYFGGAAMDSSPDIYMNGTEGDNLGISVSSAGDINKDGMSDIIAGAYTNSITAAAAGKICLYLSSAPQVKPSVFSVKDVANDQGGKVTVRWTRSGYDTKGFNKISSYIVQRSYPPQNGQFAWQNIAQFTPTKDPLYSYDASTPYDSMLNQSGTFYFRVSAMGVNSSEMWKSNIASGHSTDNLAPSAVTGFSVTAQSTANKLAWKKNTESDLSCYAIYRSTGDSINIATAVPYAYSADTVFTDLSPIAGESYYFIAAKDIHGNIAPPVSSPAPAAEVAFTAFLEGMYIPETGLMRPDTITVLLRDASYPYTLRDSVNALLSSNGTAQLKFYKAPAGKYYLVIKHRNSIETWSKTGGETLTKGSASNYNFSSLSSQSYGENTKLHDGKWCICTGDANQDGQVEATDLLLVDVDNLTYLTGYVQTDMNGDGQVEAEDLRLTDVNYILFVSSITPMNAKKRIHTGN